MDLKGEDVFMRPIKYRAFYEGEMRRVTALEWIHEGEDLAGCYLTGIDKCVTVNNDETSFGVDLLAFTGLNDRNGTPIYEGDIVYLNWSPDSINHFSVFWSENYGRFRFKLGGYGPCLDIQKECEACIEIVNWSANYHEKCEVVGNIYENPGLLKGE